MILLSLLIISIKKNKALTYFSSMKIQFLTKILQIKKVKCSYIMKNMH